MEVAAATATSFTTFRARTSAIIPSSTRNLRSKVRCSSSSSSLRASLSNGLLSPYTGGSISSDFCGAKLRSESLNPLNLSSSKPKRGVVTMVIPFSKGSAHEQPPPDLASYLFKNRIVYLGMSLVPSVTELILQSFFTFSMKTRKSLFTST
ncbi:unnamed protein product [Brassica napus]|uniref:(rape) hypothetical protein n=1 Tax=Brassica napus TaxID=3708 RepID=A0A816N4S3_BRANA|nr:unnamed protein product [Brassica napus]